MTADPIQAAKERQEAIERVRRAVEKRRTGADRELARDRTKTHTEKDRQQTYSWATVPNLSLVDLMAVFSALANARRQIAERDEALREIDRLSLVIYSSVRHSEGERSPQNVSETNEALKRVRALLSEPAGGKEEALVFSHCHACAENDQGEEGHDPGVGCHANGPSDGCEGVWVKASAPATAALATTFRRKQLVRHIKTGGLYRIVHTPATCRLEASNEPAYAYKAVEVATSRGTIVDIRDAPLWVRGQAEMEDGRFGAFVEQGEG